ncbi:lysozyme [Rhodohalobacter sulfatireducens]|uniref:Lysozyme n=1 Tax=Rhodohalobacter sulfatireducens TaxID=2911366 RepID=A0ABS9KDD6_9BACT|nr:lysozyme [Rhodohalobacter sulfatireducens]MCG2588833.1 lysozyme [Rhodohalobacter sulfatireducens]
MKKIGSLIIVICLWITGCSSSEKTAQSETSEPVRIETYRPVERNIPKATEQPTRESAEEFRTNDACIDIIKEFTGLRLEAYSDQRGNWYIGYGRSQEVTEGMKITEAEAEQYLREDLRIFEESVSRMVEVEISENEFSAMVCLTYNIGPGGFAESTVLRKVNEQAWEEAAEAILLWNKVNGQVNEALVNRREKERDLFLRLQ